jgi:hypothetical protein
MIFRTIIALVFGFLLASITLILDAKLGPVDAKFGIIIAGLLTAVFGFFGSQRLAHDKPWPEWITGGLGALLPVWLIPYLSAGPMGFAHFLPALGIVTLAIVAAIGLTAWGQRARE